MPKAYLPNVPTRFNHLDGSRAPALNLQPINDFGEPVWLTPPGIRTGPNFIHQAIEKITNALQPFTAKDYLVCIGDPILIAVAIHRAALNIFPDPVRTLRWDKNKQAYELLEVSL